MSAKSRKQKRKSDRRKARQERLKSAAANPPPKVIGEGVLTDEKTIPGDIALVKKAAEQRWPVTPDVMARSVERLDEIQSRKTVTVPCGEGVFESVAVADANAIKAAVAIRSMVEQNRKRELPPKQPAQTQINVGVNIGPDERREKLSAIASRFGIDFVPEVGTTGQAGADPEAVVRVRKTKEEDDGS